MGINNITAYNTPAVTRFIAEQYQPVFGAQNIKALDAN